MEHRAPGPLRKRFEKLDVPGILLGGSRLRIAYLGLRDLDEAFVALVEHVGERQHVLVRHAVRRHRRAVMVGLQRVGAEALHREAARAGVHRFVQQALHLTAFGGRGGPRLGRFEAHDVDHQRRGGW